MARSNSYDFTKKDVDDMFNAMQETLNEAKEEFNKKFDEKARAEKKIFSFSDDIVTENVETNNVESNFEQQPEEEPIITTDFE